MASPLPNRLISAAKVAGTAVYDTHGEKLGHIDDVMIDKASGRIAYAVLAFGGFMGFNDRHHPLPWSALRYDTTREGYVIDIDRAKLAAGPATLRPLKPDWSDQGWGQVDDYYGTRAGDGDVPLDATIPAR